MPVVASYCTTFLKPEMLHIYRQVTGLKRFENAGFGHVGFHLIRTKANHGHANGVARIFGERRHGCCLRWLDLQTI